MELKNPQGSEIKLDAIVMNFSDSNESSNGEQPSTNENDAYAEEPAPEPAAGDSIDDVPPTDKPPVPGDTGDEEYDDAFLFGDKEQAPYERVKDYSQISRDRAETGAAHAYVPDEPDQDPTAGRFREGQTPPIDEIDPEEVGNRLQRLTGAKRAIEAQEDQQEESQENAPNVIDLSENNEAQESYSENDNPVDHEPSLAPGDMMHFKDDEIREGADPAHYNPEDQNYGYAEADSFVAGSSPENDDEEVTLNAHGEGCRVVALTDNEHGALIHVDGADMFTTRGQELIDQLLENVPELQGPETKAIIFGDAETMGSVHGEEAANWSNLLKQHLTDKEIDAQIFSQGEGKDVYLRLKGSGDEAQIYAFDSDGTLLFQSNETNNG